MNRRQFLKGLLATAATAKASGVMLVRTDNSLYFNDLYGVSLTKPEEWNFHSLTQFSELAHNIENDVSHEELEALFEGEYVEPFIVMSPGVDIVPDFEPMIYIHAEILDTEKHRTFDIIHRNIIRIHEQAMKNFEITSDFNLKNILGFPSSYHIANFSQERKGKPRIEARYKMLLLRRENILYTINSVDSPKNSINTDNEFESLVSSIKFT